MYRQPRETFEVVVVGSKYRIYGTIHLIPHTSTGELLNQDRSHFPLTDSMLFDLGYDYPPDSVSQKARSSFTLVRKAEVQWIAGGRPMPTRLNPSMISRRRLAFFLGEYVLAGDLEMPRDARLSDFLVSAKPFQTLFKTSIYPLPVSGPMSALNPALTFDFVTVNLAAAGSLIEAPTDEGEIALDLMG